MFAPVIRLTDTLRVERVGLDDIRPGIKECVMDICQHLRTGDRKKIMVPLQVMV